MFLYFLSEKTFEVKLQKFTQGQLETQHGEAEAITLHLCIACCSNFNFDFVFFVFAFIFSNFRWLQVHKPNQKQTKAAAMIAEGEFKLIPGGNPKFPKYVRADESEIVNLDRSVQIDAERIGPTTT